MPVGDQNRATRSGLWSGPMAARAATSSAIDALPTTFSHNPVRSVVADASTTTRLDGPINTGQRPGTWLARQPATLLLICFSTPGLGRLSGTVIPAGDDTREP